MRHLLILAAAAFLAVGCARNQDESGAAPEQADPAVTATDTSTTMETDSTMGQRPAETDTSFVQQDTTAADATMSTDSVGAQGEVPAGDTTSATGDTTGAWTDTTSAMPSDTTAAGTSDTSADTTAAQ
ncbi:MAG TPA: hypothetical protein VFH26_08255 [Gemmatimonadales bacterium]|nr:hypothetical protein [Gemmatimonadales bacterium]